MPSRGFDNEAIVWAKLNVKPNKRNSRLDTLEYKYFDDETMNSTNKEKKVNTSMPGLSHLKPCWYSMKRKCARGSACLARFYYKIQSKIKAINNSTIKTKHLYTIVFFFAALFCWYYFSLWQNTPREDDFWFFSDLISFKTENTFFKKIQPIFLVRNSHRIVPIYLIGFAQISLLGFLHGKIFLFFGIASLFGIVCLFYKQLSSFSLVLFTSCMIVLLNPISYSITFWLFPSIQLFFMIFCVALAISLYLNKAKFFWVIILSIICTFSNGNGMLVWPSIIILILLNREFYKAFYYLIFAVISIVLFFTDYHNIGISISPFLFLEKLENFFVFIPAFIGNAVDLFPDYLYSNFDKYDKLDKIITVFRVSVIIGFGALVIYYYAYHVLCFYKKQNSKNRNLILFSIGILSFVLLSAIVASVFRSPMGVGVGVSNRYKFYGQLSICCFLVFLFCNNNFRKKFGHFILAFSIIYSITLYLIYLPKAQNYKRDSIASNLNILRNSSPYIYYVYGKDFEKFINDSLIFSIKKSKIYDFNKKSYPNINKINNLGKYDRKLELELKGENILINGIPEHVFDLKSDYFFKFYNKEKNTSVFLPILKNDRFPNYSLFCSKTKLTPFYSSFFEDNTYLILLVHLKNDVLYEYETSFILENKTLKKVELRACLNFHDRAKASKFSTEQGKKRRHTKRYAEAF